MDAIKKAVINILLNGVSGWGTDSMDQILGIPAHKATVRDMKKLTLKDLARLFHTAPAPEFESMKGEFKAMVLKVGPFAFAANFYTHHVFGPGIWEGKAFYPFSQTSGWGYNIFIVKGKGGKQTFARTCKMNTYMGLSNIDNNPSLHLDYSPYNRFMNYTMHDEIRKINDSIYLGMGYMGVGGGSLNPAPFLVYGNATKWVGPDKD